MVLRPPRAGAPGATFVSPREEVAPPDPWMTLWAALACLVPASVSLWLASGATVWRSDEATLHLLGGVLPAHGTVSALLGALLQLLPVGSVASRAAGLGSLALGLAAALVFRASRRLLDLNGATPRLTPVLASCAAIAATSSIPWLHEASLVGGHAVGAALALATFEVGAVRAGRSEFPAWRTVLLAGLLGAAALENLGAAAATGCALAWTVWQSGKLPERGRVGLFSATLAVVWLAAWAPAQLMPLLAHYQPLHAVRSGALAAALTTGPAPWSQTAPRFDVAFWLDEVGLLFLAAALVGSTWALGKGRLRRVVSPLLLLLGLDLLLGGVPTAPGVGAEPTALHLLALAVLAVLAALGIQTAALFTRRARLLGARPALVLLSVVTLAVTSAGAEDAVRVVNRRNLVATAAWTDEVLAALPPRSLVLTTSEPATRRLAVALASGARDDVTLVPLLLLGRGHLAAELLRLEPALGLLIRELSTTGRPSEHALTALADVRPLFVEAEAQWDRRLVAHLIPGPFLARFAPHALGRSDRVVALSGQSGAFERVLSAALGPLTEGAAWRPGSGCDPATLEVLSASLRNQRALHEALGDGAEAAAIGARLEQLGIEAPANARPAPTELAAR